MTAFMKLINWYLIFNEEFKCCQSETRVQASQGEAQEISRARTSTRPQGSLSPSSYRLLLILKPPLNDIVKADIKQQGNSSWEKGHVAQRLGHLDDGRQKIVNIGQL